MHTYNHKKLKETLQEEIQTNNESIGRRLVWFVPIAFIASQPLLGYLILNSIIFKSF